MSFFKNLFGPKERKEYETDRLWRTIFVGLNYQNSAVNTRAFAQEGYQGNVMVYRCIRELTTAVASVELELHTPKGDDVDVITDHDALTLLSRPNPMQSWDEFAKALFSNYLYSGNAFVWRNRPKGRAPLELHVFSPVNMEVVPGKTLVPLRYKRQVENGQSEAYEVDQLTGDCDILHVKMFNPLDPWVGMSPLQASALGVDIHNAGMRFNKALLENSARPSGALKIDAGVVPDENLIARLREQVRTMFQGKDNAGTVPLLYGGAEWQELGLSPKDMDFKESMAMAALSIAAAYGVPFPLIVPDAATFANMRDAREAMWENAVLPLLDEVLGAMSRWLLPLYGLKDSRLAYNADNVSALETKRQRKFERMARAKDSGILTINEVRAELGFDDIEGGDVLLIPSSQVPIDMAGLGFDPTAPEESPSDDEMQKALKLVGYPKQQGKQILKADFGRA